MKIQSQHKRSVIAGVTGTFGSGKTTVACAFKSLGAKVIDADKIAHSLIKPGSQIYRKIIRAFGDAILKENKVIDREKLANIAFYNEHLLKTLNSIMHPKIIQIMKARIRTAKSKIIILDAPLLIEAGLKNLTDKLIVVKINRHQQIKRILKRTSIEKTDILKRLKHQIPLRDKIRIADFVIDNNGTPNKTRRQVKEIYRKLQDPKTRRYKRGDM